MDAMQMMVMQQQLMMQQMMSSPQMQQQYQEMMRSFTNGDVNTAGDMRIPKPLDAESNPRLPSDGGAFDA